MSASDDVQREFYRQSYSQQVAITSSWASFLEFAERVITITASVVRILRDVYEILRRR